MRQIFIYTVVGPMYIIYNCIFVREGTATSRVILTPNMKYYSATYLQMYKSVESWFPLTLASRWAPRPIEPRASVSPASRSECPHQRRRFEFHCAVNCPFYRASSGGLSSMRFPRAVTPNVLSGTTIAARNKKDDINKLSLCRPIVIPDTYNIVLTEDSIVSQLRCLMP